MDCIVKNVAKRNWTWVFFLLAIFMSILPISSQSLWIDEGFTTWVASAESFRVLIETIKNSDISESLMPGYVIYMWVWVKTFGVSEYTLRLSNLPFILIVLFICAKLPMDRVFKNAFILLTIFSPLIWYYLNEVRSYIALFSFSAISLMGLLFYFYGDLRQKKIGPYLTAFGLLIGSFFNIITVFSVTALIPTKIIIKRKRTNNRDNYLLDWGKPVFFSVPVFAVLGTYYFKSILASSGGRLQGGMSVPSFKNIAFCVYEFLAFSGLGPPRNILRDNQSFIAFSPYISWLTAAVLLLFCALVYILISYKEDSIYRRLSGNAYLWGFLAGFLSFCIFAFAIRFGFYGRHVIFLYPFFIFAIAFIVNDTWSKKKMVMIKHILTASLLLLCLVSALRLRFYPKYFKDDYRSAVSIALSLAANNEPIFWAAQLETGSYYGLEYRNIDFKRPFKTKPIQKVYAASNWSIEEIRGHTRSFESGILVLSKKDAFDKKNGWSHLISEYHLVETGSCNAFKIYKFKP